MDPITGHTVEDDPDTVAYLPRFTVFGMEVLTLGPAAMTGSDVSQALPAFNNNSAQWVVNLSLTSEGSDLFAALTGEAAVYPTGDPRRQIAIVLDGQIMASPQVSEEVSAGEGITGGSAVITLGNDPAAEEQAQNLAVILRYGSLPVAFERSQVEKVSATLGSDSLQIGLISGVAGLILVAVVLLLYYRVLGLVAVLGIAVFGSLLIAIYSLLGHYQGVTLTLAGITGIIVAVGITAGLLHRLLRADQGGTPGGENRPLRRIAGFSRRVSHHSHRRHGLYPRGHASLVVDGGSGEGLRALIGDRHHPGHLCGPGFYPPGGLGFGP